MSLAQEHPELAAQWRSERDIASVSPGSGFKARWACSVGHEWEAPVYRRVAGAGCPYCSGRLAIPGVNDLATTHPDLAEEWADSTPVQGYKAGSTYKAQWRCSEGHTWAATVQNRTLRASGCPVCSGRVADPGKTDLESVHPELAAEWADDRPVSSFTAGAKRQARWKCAQGHTWTASVANRRNGTGCPQCAGRYQEPLSVTHPHLVASWDDARDIAQVTAGMRIRVHWKCDQGHKWVASLRNNRCRVCDGLKSLPGFNDIATTHPELSAEWADERSVQAYTVRSSIAVRWRCGRGHSWEMSPAQRARGGACPTCANRNVLAGFNDLATTHPELAAQMVSKPETVTFGSARKLKWECDQGHIWAATVASRSQGHGCPVCSGAQVLPGFNDFASAHPGLVAQWADPERSPHETARGSGRRVRWKCEQGHYWYAPVFNRPRAGCPECAARSYISSFESEIADYVKSLGVQAETSVRRFKGQGVAELDTLIPSLGIAIEANGVYWHSEAHKKKTYHHDKHDACEALGIRLIQVWEDDWADRRPIVKRMLAHKLGVSTELRIPARTATARLATTAEARAFLNANHIQGFTGATYHLGLEHEGRLVALMSVKRTGKPGELRLERYATAAHVLGGQSKLIRFAERAIPNWDHLLTFADREVSDGGLYERTGWVKDGELAPDYKYLVRGCRVHKFGYRLARFQSDPTLKYEPGLTERELAALNGILRVWDSGKIRYRYDRQA